MGDPIARVQNPYPKNVVEFVKNLPKTEMSNADFKQYMENCKWGAKAFLSSYYQICCQVGLYYIDENDVYHPRFTKDISEEEAERYLKNWFPKYYVPNPYTRGFTNLEKPILVEYSIYEYLKNNGDNSIESVCAAIFREPIGNPDIFVNAINHYSKIIKVESNHCFIKEGIEQMKVMNSRDDRKAFFENFDENQNNISTNSNATKYTSPIQKIFYGVPGCGKSHKISEMLEDKNIFDITSEENQIVRTVFHPDYTNADFVGQILPEVKDDKIEYNFKAGPFTEILAKALVHSENQYVLIIEEINRGNSAAIFGEIFQLLDRVESGATSSTDGLNKYGKGWSEYFFMNDLINEYVRKMASSSDTIETSVQINGITFTINTGIRLPPNLSLLATMNTSDQNVFTLDNAFQRRWDMEYISNRYDESKANEKQKAQYNSKIGSTEISWGKFRDAINKEISNPENSFANAEDKQLGLFFIKAENNVINESDFSNKVLKYLWNDISKRDKSIFNDEVSTFGDLLEAFNGADAFEKSFSSDFLSKISE